MPSAIEEKMTLQTTVNALYLKSNRLVTRREQLENSFDSPLAVEGGNHRFGMLGHEGDQELKDVLDVVVLVNRVKEIEHGLQFVIEHSIAFEN